MAEFMPLPQRRLCRLTMAGLWGLLLLVLLMPLAVWLGPSLGLPHLHPAVADLPMSMRWRALAAGMPTTLALSMLLYCWIVVFKGFSLGHFLHPDSARWIGRAGWSLVLLAPARVLSESLTGMALHSQLPGPHQLSVTAGSNEAFLLLSGVILLVLGRVWRYACAVHEEWQHTI